MTFGHFFGDCLTITTTTLFEHLFKDKPLKLQTSAQHSSGATAAMAWKLLPLLALVAQALRAVASGFTESQIYSFPSQMRELWNVDPLQGLNMGWECHHFNVFRHINN
jgi:hypothetical protein